MNISKLLRQYDYQGEGDDVAEMISIMHLSAELLDDAEDILSGFTEHDGLDIQEWRRRYRVPYPIETVAAGESS